MALRAEYGVALALGGQTDEAERAFMSVLSEDPSHPGALNNLGNLYLVRGDVSVALAFYMKAAEADSTDAGIVLNRSVALMLMGDNPSAKAEAARALDMLGGVGDARSLLGLPGSETEEELPKAADQAFLTQSEIEALLAAAASSVPADTAAVAAGDSTEVPREAAADGAATWRSAGPRASDTTELETMLYWKR